MRSYLLRRLLAMVPTFLGVTLVTFVLIELLPGDPLSAAGDAATLGDGARASYRRAMGLDGPLPLRYLEWLGRVATFDFGASSYDHRPVAEKLAEALPNTLALTGLAMLFAWLVAVPLGVWTAVRDGRPGARVVNGALFALYSLPSFWVAVVLVLLFGGGRWFDLFPSQGLVSAGTGSAPLLTRLLDRAWHLVLPVSCLTYVQLAWLTRHVRSAMLEALSQDYVRTARAKGLPERTVIFKHALRNALVPLVTLLGTSVPALVGGSVVIEQFFGIAGMGRLGFQAVLTHDYPTMMAVTALTALVTMAGTLAADLACFAVDPRIRAT